MLATATLAICVLSNNTVLLNEYNAIAPTNLAKNAGYDAFHGRADGNGGNWIEFVVVDNGVDLSRARIEVTQNALADIILDLPDLDELADLRAGTLVTLSDKVQTDLSYSPFERRGDWWININVSDTVSSGGAFQVTNNEATILLSTWNGTDHDPTMDPSGEGVFGTGLDAFEVFKLKGTPSTFLPGNSPLYADDSGQQVLSTFGQPNRWIDPATGQLREQDVSLLRARVVGGLREVAAVRRGPPFPRHEGSKLFSDAEAIAYVPRDNQLWLADDDNDQLIALNRTTGDVAWVVSQDEFAGLVSPATPPGDLEAVAYDASLDFLYAFSGSNGGPAYAFQLTRSSPRDPFRPTTAIALGGVEYPAAVVVAGQLLVANGDEIKAFDFQSGTEGMTSLYATPDGSQIYDLEFKGTEMWVATSNIELHRVSWPSGASVEVLDMTLIGIGDLRGVAVVGNRVYLVDGFDGLRNPVLTHAIRVAEIANPTALPSSSLPTWP